MQIDETSLPLLARQFLFVLRAFLPRIGQAELVDSIRIEEQSDTEHTIMLPSVGIGIDTGYPVPVRLILNRALERPGLRVFSLETTAGSRWHPPETVDATRCETESHSEALLKIAELLAELELNGLPDLPEALRPAEAIEEDVYG